MKRYRWYLLFLFIFITVSCARAENTDRIITDQSYYDYEDGYYDGYEDGYYDGYEDGYEDGYYGRYKDRYEDRYLYRHGSGSGCSSLTLSYGLIPLTMLIFIKRRP